MYTKGGKGASILSCKFLLLIEKSLQSSEMTNLCIKIFKMRNGIMKMLRKWEKFILGF